jgi:cytochrome P450 family 628
MRSPLPDFYTYFSQNPQAIKDGPADAQLAVIAGADTTALTLIHIFYILARYPDIQSNLHAELDPLPASAEDSGLVSDQYLAPRPYLNGIINEVLRLYSPVPAALQRLTPPEGATIAGRYVPGNMNVSVPTYALHRDPRAFAQPDEFIPERWSSQPELIIRKDAFIAFSYGPENCVGRPLAMMQLRMLVARIARRFEVSVPKGADKEWRKFEEEKADCFVMDVRKLPMAFKERVKH